MKKIMSLTILLIAAGSAQAQLHTTPLFPLNVGTRWTYVVTDGKEAVKGEKKKIVTIEVERQEPYIRKKKGADNKEVEVKTTGFILKMTSGANVTRDHVVVLEDGVYKVYVGATKTDPPLINPPLCAIKLGGKGTWEADSKSGNTTVKGSFSVHSTTVKVLAGNFDDPKKTFRVSFTNNIIGEDRVETDIWYAKDVGMVRQRILQKGREIVLELEKYEPAK